MKKFLYLIIAGSMFFSVNAFAETKTASSNDVKIQIHVLDQNLKYITRNDKALIIQRKKTAPSREEKILENVIYNSQFHTNVLANGAMIDIVPKKSYSTYAVMEKSNKGYVENKDYAKQSVSFPQESREVVLLPKGNSVLTANMSVPAPVVAHQKKIMLELNMKPFSGAYIKGKTNLKVRYRAVATRSGTSQQTTLTSSSPKVVFAGLRTGLYSFKYRALIVDKRGVEVSASKWSPLTRAYAGYPLETVSFYDHLYEPAIEEVKSTYYLWAGPKTHTYYDGTMTIGNVPEEQIYTAGIHNGKLVDIRYTYEVKRSDVTLTKKAAVGEKIYMHDREGNSAIVSCKENDVRCSDGGCVIRTLISGAHYDGTCYITPLSNLKRGQYYDYRYRIEFLKNGKPVGATNWSDQGRYRVPHAVPTDYMKLGNAGKSLFSFRPLDISSKGEYFMQIDGPTYLYGVFQPARKIQPGNSLADNIVVTNRDTGKVTQFGTICDKAAKPLDCRKLPLNQLFPAGRYEAKFKSDDKWSPVLDFTLTK